MSTHRLREALVALDPHTERMYYQSPEFHAGIEMLCRVLPKFVELMVSDAEALEERRFHATEGLQTSLTRRGW